MCNDLRADGVPVYFSTDTGPTVVFFTHRNFEDQVVARLSTTLPGFEIVRGQLGGPAALVDVTAAKTQLGVE